MKFTEELKREKQLHLVFMNMASEVASLSRCNRRKVGAIILLPDNSIVYGYNGTPKKTCNNCEDKNGVTKPNVIHAEINAVLKATKSLEGSVLYVTTQPCLHCAAILIQKGISKVYYKEEYHSNEGVDYLIKNGIYTEKL